MKRREFKKVKDVVEQVLNEDKRARSNDTWLIIETLRRMGYKLYIPYDQINRMPSFETITRCRRKFQENGVFVEEGIKKRRASAETEVRKINEWW